jgi:hypothetical protein
MDFQEIDIENYLFAAIPVRFQDTDPKDFEDFIAFLFLENGYKLEQTPYSADFGADLIVEFDGVRTAVQVKRYYESHKIGVQEINQVIGAKEYYSCDAAMMITTSSYTKAGKELGPSANVIMWDWYRLNKAIQDTFLEGLDYYEFFKRYPVAENASTVDIVFKLSSIELANNNQDQEGNSIIRGELKNQSNQNIRVYCELPVYITHKRKQFTALDWTSESFKSGVIYSQASVDLVFCFSKRQLFQLHKKDRVIITLHLVPGNEQIILEEKVKNLKEECFLVTFYFGRASQIYHDMIAFRDQILTKSWLGRRFISLYYLASPTVIKVLAGSPKIAKWLKPLVSGMVEFCLKILKKSN